MRRDPRHEDNLLNTRRDNVQNFEDVSKFERPYHWLNGSFTDPHTRGKMPDRFADVTGITAYTCKLVNARKRNPSGIGSLTPNMHVTDLERRNWFEERHQIGSVYYSAAKMKWRDL